MDPATIMMMLDMAKKSGILGGGPIPNEGQTGPNPNAGPSKFQMGLSESMGIPAPTKGVPSREDMDPMGSPPIGGTGEITVNAPAPFIGPGFTPGESGEIMPSGGEAPGGPGGGGGGPGGGGLPPWFQKLGMGAQVGESLGQKAPPPPSLPGGGRFDMQNSLPQWLQIMMRGR